MVWFCWCPGQYKPALRQSNPRQVPESSMNASVTAGKRPSMLQNLFVCPVDARLSLPWSSIEGVGRVRRVQRPVLGASGNPKAGCFPLTPPFLSSSPLASYNLHPLFSRPAGTTQSVCAHNTERFEAQRAAHLAVPTLLGLGQRAPWIDWDGLVPLNACVALVWRGQWALAARIQPMIGGDIGFCI